MSTIEISQSGDFKKLTSFLEKAKHIFKLSDLDKYGREGVNALRAATPVDSGLTADSWSYEISQGQNGPRIDFYNSNVNDYVNIAIILQTGHGTRNGGYVQGRDYINPAIRPIFDKIVDSAWREVTGK